MALSFGLNTLHSIVIQVKEISLLGRTCATFRHLLAVTLNMLKFGRAQVRATSFSFDHCQCKSSQISEIKNLRRLVMNCGSFGVGFTLCFSPGLFTHVLVFLRLFKLKNVTNLANFQTIMIDTESYASVYFMSAFFGTTKPDFSELK